MNQQQQALVRSSFADVAPIAGQAAEMFYARLFELDPSLRPLFKGDMKRQGAMLMAVIGTAVANLDRLETILPTVSELGRRHAGYGVKDSDYDTVAVALLDTLATALKQRFTAETREAWTLCYLTLAGVMKAGAVAGGGKAGQFRAA